MRNLERSYFGFCWNLRLAIVSWRILASFRGFIEDYSFAQWNIWVSIILLLPSDTFSCKWQGHSVIHPLLLDWDTIIVSRFDLMDAIYYCQGFWGFYSDWCMKEEVASANFFQANFFKWWNKEGERERERERRDIVFFKVQNSLWVARTNQQSDVFQNWPHWRTKFLGLGIQWQKVLEESKSKANKTKNNSKYP